MAALVDLGPVPFIDGLVLLPDEKVFASRC
jgi:hypothetical protein